MRAPFTAWIALAAAAVFAALTACAPVEEPHVQKSAYGSPEEVADAKDALRDAPEPAEPITCVMPEVISNGSRKVMRIALTFDACSTKENQYDARITRTLEEEKAPATIFVGGGWAHKNPEVVEALANDPLFEVGNHTYTHPHMTRVKSDETVLNELLTTQAEIYDHTGVLPRWFRPPYGEYDARVAHLAAEAGLVTVEYDLASGDPDVRHATKKRLVDWVLAKAQPGSIVVMHMNHKKFHTAEALPEVIRGLRAKGYELVTMSQLMQDIEPVCRNPQEAAPPEVAARVPKDGAISTRPSP